MEWAAAADSSTVALINYFWNENSGFFNSTSKNADGRGWNYWPQAHAMDVIIDAYLRTNDSRYSDMFDKWFEGIKLQNDGGNTNVYTNDFYDDEAWIALTMTRLYNVTKN
ncbi:MAG: glycosyl hydrolase family 76, partial [Muribaculaceae bacterium]|nr:glycosyl hydrolase family 76 [Muribaculaceae bacterium]